MFLVEVRHERAKFGADPKEDSRFTASKRMFAVLL